MIKTLIIILSMFTVNHVRNDCSDKYIKLEFGIIVTKLDLLVSNSYINFDDKLNNKVIIYYQDLKYSSKYVLYKLVRISHACSVRSWI